MSPVLLIAFILFAIVLLFFAVYSFFTVFILFDFSLNKTGTLILVCVFVAISVLLLFTIFLYLAQIDWNAPAFPFLQQIL